MHHDLCLRALSSTQRLEGVSGAGFWNSSRISGWDLLGVRGEIRGGCGWATEHGWQTCLTDYLRTAKPSRRNTRTLRLGT